MSEFILLFRGGNMSEQESPEKMQAHMVHWMQWMNGLQTSGKFISAQPLNNTGRLIAGNHKIIAEGPFGEDKHQVGGYLVCKATDYDEAMKIASGCPVLESEDGMVEIREIREIKS